MYKIKNTELCNGNNYAYSSVSVQTTESKKAGGIEKENIVASENLFYECS